MHEMRTLKLCRSLLAILLATAACCHAETTIAWVLESAGFQETILSTSSTEKDQLPGTATKKIAKGVHRVLETDVRQLPVWQKSGFTDEGIVSYVADRDGPGRLAVLQYSKGERRLWVVSTAAQTKVEQDGWTRQGVHFCLWPVDHK